VCERWRLREQHRSGGVHRHVSPIVPWGTAVPGVMHLLDLRRECHASLIHQKGLGCWGSCAGFVQVLEATMEDWKCVFRIRDTPEVFCPVCTLSRLSGAPDTHGRMRSNSPGRNSLFT
jgi:hypothetical protein